MFSPSLLFLGTALVLEQRIPMSCWSHHSDHIFETWFVRRFFQFNVMLLEKHSLLRTTVSEENEQTVYIYDSEQESWWDLQNQCLYSQTKIK